MFTCSKSSIAAGQREAKSNGLFWQFEIVETRGDFVRRRLVPSDIFNEEGRPWRRSRRNP